MGCRSEAGGSKESVWPLVAGALKEGSIKYRSAPSDTHEWSSSEETWLFEVSSPPNKVISLFQRGEFRENPWRLSYIVLAFLLIVHHEDRELSCDHSLHYLLVWQQYFCWKHLCSSYWVPVRDFCGCTCSWVAWRFPIPLQKRHATWPACTPAAWQLCLQQAQGP